MPGPDPDAVWLERHDDRLSVSYESYFWTGKVGHRRARAIALLRRASRSDLWCRWCGDELPEWRRTDALYCCEGCRKRAARRRRAWRASAQGLDPIIGQLSK